MVPSLVDRRDYPTLREAVYLNQASLGLIGSPAVNAMHDLLDRVVRHGNLHMSDEEEVAFLDGLRERAARLLAVDGSRVAILSSASELLGQAPFLLSPPPGSKVVAVASDFPAITRPWLRLSGRGECLVEFVEDRPESDLTADLIARIDDRTSVVAVGWVQYATGTVIDVPRLRAATAAAGARLVLDATQGAGAMRCDAGAWGADLVVSSGYKWLGGHGGVALGALAPDVVAQTPALPGWMGAPSPFAFDARRMPLAEDARRFTQSTMSYVSVVGLTAALDQLLAAGLENVEHHATRLRDLLLDTVEDRGWQPFRHRGSPAAASHIVSLARPGERVDGVLARLRDAADRVRRSAEAGSGCPWPRTTTKTTLPLWRTSWRSESRAEAWAAGSPSCSGHTGRSGVGEDPVEEAAGEDAPLVVGGGVFCWLIGFRVTGLGGHRRRAGPSVRGPGGHRRPIRDCPGGRGARHLPDSPFPRGNSDSTDGDTEGAPDVEDKRVGVGVRRSHSRDCHLGLCPCPCRARRRAWLP